MNRSRSRPGRFSIVHLLGRLAAILLAAGRRLVASFRRLLGWLFHRRRDHRQRPEAPPSTVLQLRAPGELAPPVMIGTAQLAARFRGAFARAAAGDGVAPAADVVWVDGGHELLVRAGEARLVTRTGFALVGIPVYSEGTGDVEIVVPFAVGSLSASLGLIAATEPRPRGPAEIVDAWGDPLIATAWDALLRVAAEAAAEAGVDDRNQPLIAAALVAADDGVTVTPQARHPMDRSAT